MKDENNDKRRLVTEPSSMELLAHTLSLPELLDGARRSLPSHIGELHRRFGPHILRRLQTEDSTVTAAEILSDVFMRLPSALEGYEENGKFEAWLWVMARNAMHDKRRKRQRQPDQLASDFDVPATGRPGQTFERTETVDKLLALLAPRQREVLLLNLEGYSDPDIANKLGITANNVAQLLFRARTRVRQEALAMGLTPSDILDPER